MRPRPEKLLQLMRTATKESFHITSCYISAQVIQSLLRVHIGGERLGVLADRFVSWDASEHHSIVKLTVDQSTLGINANPLQLRTKNAPIEAMSSQTLIKVFGTLERHSGPVLLKVIP